MCRRATLLAWLQMRWKDVRAAYPAQWLVVEIIEQRVAANSSQRIVEELAVIELCADGCAAKHRYLELRRQMPDRGLCFLHTSYPKLPFDELACPELARTTEPTATHAP